MRCCTVPIAPGSVQLLASVRQLGDAMTKHLHVIAFVMFLVVLGFNLIVWGAVPSLPDVGPDIERSAGKEAMFASGYIALGRHLDAAVPSLGNYGAKIMTASVGESFARIREQPNVAMDLILSSRYNRTHGWLKFCYWAAPALLVLTILLWARRPKKVRLIGAR